MATTTTTTSTSASTGPGLIERLRVYYQQVRTEMAKVAWPSKEAVRTYTIVVFVATIVVCILMGLWDRALSLAIRTVLGLRGGGA